MRDLLAQCGGEREAVYASVGTVFYGPYPRNHRYCGRLYSLQAVAGGRNRNEKALNKKIWFHSKIIDFGYTFPQHLIDSLQHP